MRLKMYMHTSLIISNIISPGLRMYFFKYQLYRFIFIILPYLSNLISPKIMA